MRRMKQRSFLSFIEKTQMILARTNIFYFIKYLYGLLVFRKLYGY